MIELFSKEDVTKYTQVREGETKLGECLTLPQSTLHESLAKFEGKYVLLGVPEDIGPLANHGKKGARHAWHHFLANFLNVQHNDFLDPSLVMILGQLNVDDLLNTADQLDPEIPEELQRLRELVAIIDERLARVIKAIVSENKIPIVIGGGHNNAYGLISGTVAGQQSDDKKAHQISVINLDPHADFRALEGRHSGNAFSYAFDNQLLASYHVVGLHENYNSNNILNKFIKHNTNLSYYAFDHYLDNPISMNEIAQNALKTANQNQIGLEIDLDSIAHFPSSAKTPSGWTVNQTRSYVRAVSQHKNIVYLHLTESAPDSEHEDHHLIGKTLTYLVTDFVKQHNKFTL